MSSDRVETVVKLALQLEELRRARDRQMQQFDNQIRVIETKLAREIGEEASDKPDQPASLQGRMVEVYRANPNISVEKMADVLYAETSDKAKQRVRSMQYTLKTKGRIREENGRILVVD